MATNALPHSRPGGHPTDPQARTLSCQLALTGARLVAEGRAVWDAQLNDGSEVLISGNLARCVPGERLILQGRWRREQRHGWIFAVSSARSALDQTPDGIARWLAARLPGVGPLLAEAAVSHFSPERIYAVLDEDPARLGEVRSPSGRRLADGKVERAVQLWPQLVQLRQIETWLLSHGLTLGLIERIYRRYGEASVQVLQHNPYRLTQLRGIGFLRADEVARSLGVSANDPRRIRAAVSYLLIQAEGDGHAFLTRQQLEHRAKSELGINDPVALSEALSVLARGGGVQVEADGGRIYRREIWQLETQVAQRVREMLIAPSAPLFPITPSATGGALTPEQWRAVRQASSCRLSLLNGGPGTGKSATMNELSSLAVAQGVTVALCAPTGKAARRLGELTGLPSLTVHRLLEYSPAEGRFLRDHKHPLDAQLVICDEASMLSLDLAEALLAAINNDAHLLLVGDPDQLPAVGIGNVLGDLVASHQVPRVQLTRVFRQAARSLTISNARRLNAGEMPFLQLAEARAALGDQIDPDFFFIPRNSAETIRREVLSLCCERLPRMFDLDAARDVCVLSPQKAGPIGVDALNDELERRLNRQQGPPILPGRALRVGSRVVQTRNDHAFGVMNGETGVISGYQPRQRQVQILLDEGRALTLPVEAMFSFQLGHALTVHKAQGSEFRVCILVASFAHWTMLDRATIYTAMTRGRELTIVVGERRAIKVASQRETHARRNTRLSARVSDAQLSGQLF